MIKSASIGNDIISYVYVGDFKIFGIPYPLEVLRADNIGLWWNFEDSDTLSQTIAPFTQVNGGDPVAYVYDKGMHGINGSQPITTKRMTYNITNGVVSSDMVDDGLEVSFPNSINSAYMIVDNYMGVYTYRINLSANNSLISTGYVNKYLWNNVKNIFISTTLNSYEQSNIEEYYRNNNTPSIITDFSYTWYKCSGLTQFPLIDTSSGINFYGTWENCSGLTSFPAIDTSSGTSFSYTWFGCYRLTQFPSINTSLGTMFNSSWQSCSGLTQFPLIDTSSGTLFTNAWNGCSKLTEFPLIDTSSGTNFGSAWNGCSKLTEFPLIDTSSGTNFSSAWNGCSGLTSFPAIDTSSGTNFGSAWNGCSGLTSFPAIDTSSGTNFISAWHRCSGLTQFPLIDTSSGTNFTSAWSNCFKLTQFPAIDTSSGTSFSNAWNNCFTLTQFPPNVFDNVKTGDFSNAFTSTILTEQSIDNILTSLVTSGISTGTRTFKQSGGSAPSVTIGQPAIDTLRVRGWTITVTGGY